MQLESLIEEILKDRKSGSSKIIKRTLELLKIVDESKRKEICSRILAVFPSMAGLKYVANCIEKNLRVDEIIDKIEDMNMKTSKNLAEIVEDRVVATLSRSHIVEKGLLSAKKINVLESKPAMEGLEMARWLKGRGKEVKVFYDAFLSYAVKKSDLVIVGADTILRNGFVNKTGTLPLALVAKYFCKDFYVASPSYKAASNIEFEEIFEFVDSNLVTAVVWERGISKFEDFVIKIFKN